MWCAYFYYCTVFLSLEHSARIIESSKTSRSSRLSSNATNFSRRSYTFTTSDREAKSSLTDSEKVLLLFSWLIFKTFCFYHTYLFAFKETIVFFGKDITSEAGLYAYKSSLVLLPIIPMFILVVQCLFTMPLIIEHEAKLTKFESQVHNAKGPDHL